MKITIDIPDAITTRCRELNIPEEKIPEVFQQFVYDEMGFNSHWGIDSFLMWTETEDNYVDFLPEL